MEKIYFNKFLHQIMELKPLQVDRDLFLREAFMGKVDKEIVDDAICYGVMEAGIKSEVIDKIADKYIDDMTKTAAAVSFLSGLPGGGIGIAAIPVDMLQFYGKVFVILQKLIYLYGGDSLIDDKGRLKGEAVNIITICIACMVGIKSASDILSKVSMKAFRKASISLIEKQFSKEFFNKSVQKIGAMLGKELTKEAAAKGVSKIVPVIGGVISGGVTYISFKKMSVKLKDKLSVKYMKEERLKLENNDDEG